MLRFSLKKGYIVLLLSCDYYALYKMADKMVRADYYCIVCRDHGLRSPNTYHDIPHLLV
jgi:hypothetical protein